MCRKYCDTGGGYRPSASGADKTATGCADRSVAQVIRGCVSGLGNGRFLRPDPGDDAVIRSDRFTTHTS